MNNRERILHGYEAIEAGDPGHAAQAVPESAIDAITNILHAADDRRPRLSLDQLERILSTAFDHFLEERNDA